MTPRIATIVRKTRETDITLTLNLDGTGETSIRTGIGFLDHMLTTLARHARFDLTLTCTGDLSRNRSVGLELGRGRQLDEILAEMTMVAEGVRTAKSAYNLSRREGVEMPIVEQVYAVLYQGMDVQQAVDNLMSRALRHERD